MGSVGNTQSQSVNRVSLYGEEYDLPDALEYANSKYPIPDRMREFEDKHKNRKTEYGNLIDSNGYSITGDVRGKSGSVGFYVSDWKRADSMSHIHPRSKNDAGFLGGTFSKEDIEAAFRYNNVRFIRAVAQEGIYTFDKSNITETASKNLIREYENLARSEYKATRGTATRLYDSYQRRDITYEQYEKGMRDANNQMLINLHKYLLSNQKKYGYKYQLEEV